MIYVCYEYDRYTIFFKEIVFVLCTANRTRRKQNWFLDMFHYFHYTLTVAQFYVYCDFQHKKSLSRQEKLN